MTSNKNLLGCQIFDESDLPSGWECASLKERMELEYGRALREEDRRPGDIDVFGSNGKVGTHNVAWLPPPGVVVGRKGTVGAVHYSEKPFWPIHTAYYVRPRLANDNLRFIYYLLEHLPLALLNAATGVPGLSRRDAYALRGAFPPWPEQERIVSLLDAANAALRATRAAASKASRLKRGVMQDLLPEWVGFRRALSGERLVGGLDIGWRRSFGTGVQVPIVVGFGPKRRTMWLSDVAARHHR